MVKFLCNVLNDYIYIDNSWHYFTELKYLKR